MRHASCLNSHCHANYPSWLRVHNPLRRVRIRLRKAFDFRYYPSLFSLEITWVARWLCGGGLKRLFESSRCDINCKKTMYDIQVCHVDWCFQFLTVMFQIAVDQKVASKPPTHCCCGVDSLDVLVMFGVPAQKGKRQQRRVCVTEEWTEEESAPPSSESAEHASREWKLASGCPGLVKLAATRGSVRLCTSEHRRGATQEVNSLGWDQLRIKSKKKKQQKNVAV